MIITAGKVLRKTAKMGMRPFEILVRGCLQLASLLLVKFYNKPAMPNSVLHISYMVHIPYHTTRILRKAGWIADYMAIGRSKYWDKADYCVVYSRITPLRALQEFFWFWTVVVRYQVIHCHFMHTLSETGWELAYLKRMGRRIIVNYRGCEIRDRELNMKLHPDVNICQECDYYNPVDDSYFCQIPSIARRRELAREYGDVVLVTTPDMKDFAPDAIHFPFFVEDDSPADAPPLAAQPSSVKPLRMVHATNHQGIEGTRHIAAVVERLQKKGIDIEFISLRGVTPDIVLAELKKADLSIGKMKMGYYANFQIESMILGVPAVTWIRPEFMTEELTASGFIFSSLADLEKTLEYYYLHPDELAAKRQLARESVLRLHDNRRLAGQLAGMYGFTTEVYGA